MTLDCDGISFSSVEARAHYIGMDKAGRQQWRDAHATPMRPPLRSQIVVDRSASQTDSPITPREQLSTERRASDDKEREELLRAMHGANLSSVSDADLYKSIKLLQAFCTGGNENRKAEINRRQGELHRRESAARFAASGRQIDPRQAPSISTAMASGKFGELLTRTMPVHQFCDTNRRNSQVTGAWSYLQSKGLDPAVLPPSLVCVPYLHPPCGAILGLATDEDGNVLAAQAIMIERDGQLATQFGDGSGKINKVGDKGWYSRSAVRMPGPVEGPIVLAEGISTAIAIWQATGHECWAVLGAKRFSKVPLPEDRNVIIALDADNPDSPGAKDAAKALSELGQRRSFKVVRPEGDRGYDFCDLLRDRGDSAVRDTIATAEDVEHKPKSRRAKAERPGARDLRQETEDGRALIEEDSVHLTETLDLVEVAMRDRDAPVFQRGSELVRIHRLDHQEVKDDVEVTRSPGALVIRDYSAPQFRERIYSHVQFWRPSSDENGGFVQADAAVPKWAVEHLLDRDERWSWNPLKGIVEAPCMRDDGTVLDKPGYDPVSGLYYDNGGAFFEPIPDMPTKEDALSAIKKLDEVVKGFPFGGNVDGLAKCPSRSVALSLMISPFVCRVAKPPAHLADANAPRSGKSLLINSASMIATGKRAAHLDWDESDAENVKRLSGVLLQGDLMLSIDNVERPLGGSFLCSVLTQDTVQVRVLGRTGQPHVATNMLIAASGNNIKVKGDLSVRSIKFRLDARRERPGERTFELDLYRYIPAHRGELVPACLTILRAWAIALPDDRKAVLDKLKPMGGFEGWSERVRAALVWLAEHDPCATIDDVIEQEEGEAKYSALVAGWVAGLNACKKLGTQDGCDVFGGTDEANDAMWCSLDEVIAAAESTPALKAALAEITPREVKQPSQSLGTFLKPFLDRAVGLTDGDGKRRVYRIRKRQHPRLRTMQYLAEEIEQPAAAA